MPLTDDEKQLIEKPLPEALREYKLLVEEAVEKVKEVFDKPFGGIMWPVEIDFSLDPIHYVAELRRYTHAPCGSKLRMRRSMPMLKYYHHRHIERHQCAWEVPSWGTIDDLHKE